MNCIELMNGHDVACGSYARKYVQRAVLINKSAVDEYLILSPVEGECRYRIAFTLFEDLHGFLFTSPENGNNIFGKFSMVRKERLPQYKHSVQLAVMGVNESNRCVLDELDNAEYFAALQYYDGTVEIYGFTYGLQTVPYEYDPANNAGGGLIVLESNVEEDDMPYIYFNGDGTETDDFDNLFEGIEGLPHGDFNDDFSDDFYNE